MPDDDSFKPPSNFIQASMARVAKIKERKNQRVLDSGTNSAPSSPPTHPGSSIFHQSRQSHDARESNLVASIQGNIRKAAQIEHGSSLQNSYDSKNDLSIGSPPMIRRRRSESNQNLNSRISSTKSPSKTVVEVERLKQLRIERRKEQSELKKAREGLNEEEQKIIIYREVIDKFRLEFARKRADLKLKLLNVSDNTQMAKRKKRPKIQVCVRKRPLNAKEMSNHAFDVITAATEAYPYAHVYLHEPKVRLDMSKDINTHRFSFDHVFDENASNADIYDANVNDLIKNLFKGGRVSLFAYGQTGSGKTHTLFGSKTIPGVFDYVCENLFKYLKSTAIQRKQLSVRVSFFEVYGGYVFDLFSQRQRVQLLEDNKGDCQLLGHNEIVVDNLEEMIRMVRLGIDQRTTGTTEANSQSSRSHAVIQIQLTKPDGSVYGKFSLVDLAGSERGVETGNISRQARLEGSEINKSLLALKECIRALHKSSNVSGSRDQQVHIPFRASKLTQILRDSFIGKKSQTVMLAMISPASYSAEHSLNTLRYADRVKEFQNHSKMHQESSLPQPVEIDLEYLISSEDHFGIYETNPSPTEVQLASPDFENFLVAEFTDDEDSDDDEDANMIQADSKDKIPNDKPPSNQSKHLSGVVGSVNTAAATATKSGDQTPLLWEMSPLSDSKEAPKIKFGMSQFVSNFSTPSTKSGSQKVSADSSPNKQDEQKLNTESQQKAASIATRKSAVSSTYSENDLEEQEDLINQHLACVAANGLLAKRERIILSRVAEDHRDINEYVREVDEIISERIRMWQKLKSKLEIYSNRSKGKIDLI